jgi:hypothetical protein
MKLFMKSKKVFALSFVLVFSIGNVVGVSASSTLQEIKAYLDNSIHIVVNGLPFVAHESDGSVLSPINYNGRTYLPLKAVAEATGMVVNWDANSRTATLGSSSSTDVQGNQLYTSADKSFQLSLPNGWIRNDKIIQQSNPLSDFGAYNPSNDYFLGVVKVSKSSFTDQSTLDNYSKLILDQLKENIQDLQIKSNIDLSINGYSAKQFTVTGIINTIKSCNITTIVETKTSYYQLTLLSTSDKLDKLKNDSDIIIQSFKELN